MMVNRMVSCNFEPDLPTTLSNSYNNILRMNGFFRIDLVAIFVAYILRLTSDKLFQILKYAKKMSHRSNINPIIYAILH